METYPSKNIAITWVEKGSIARNLFLALGFAILTALSAQIRIVIPISPVPITGQTFVVLLSGLILGSTFGAISMLKSNNRIYNWIFSSSLCNWCFCS